MTDPATKSYGYGLNTEHHKYDNTESWDAGYGEPAFSVNEFKQLVTDYYNKIVQPDQVKAAQNKVKAAKKALAKAKKADKKSAKKVRRARKVKRQAMKGGHP